MAQTSGIVLLPLLLKRDYWRDGIEFRYSTVYFCSEGRLLQRWHNEVLESVMCDILKIRLKRRDER